MSIAPASRADLSRADLSRADLPVRRVRHQARDAAALMAFSAATSLALAVGFLLLALLARQA